MTHQIHAYLDKITRRSGLSQREKTEWTEEMSAHLYEERNHLMQSGFDEEAATELALKKFGTPDEIRKRLARETFGLPVRTIYGLFTTFLLWFLVDLYILYVLTAHSWYPRYHSISGYISDILTTIPESPSLMLALALCALMLFKTRCGRDRASMLLTLLGFGLIWTMLRLPMPFDVNRLLFGFRDLTIRPLAVGVITGVLIAWGLALYLWTRNVWMSVLPTLVSMVAGLWPPVMGMANPLIMAHPWILLNSILGITARGLPIGILLLLFRVLNKYIRPQSITVR